MPGPLIKVSKLGYWLVFFILVLTGWLGLGTPLIAVLFSYFTLEKLHFVKSRFVAIILFSLLVSAIFYGFGFFLNQANDALPKIVEESFPKIMKFAQDQGVDLPFEDIHDLKGLAKSAVTSQLGYLVNFAKIATKEFAFVLIGIVVAACIFLNPKLDLDKGRHAVSNNLYSFACDCVVAQFSSFYRSFARVMGAQMIISTLNTGFTAVYVMVIGLPYAALVIVVTFLCGLFPIIGNLISNTVIVALSFTISPKLAIISLTYLVVLHKLEYFLNSKIIGDRIRNPVWLTLLGLIIGERLMGIPGMILAPVVLNYIKVEASSIALTAGQVEELRQYGVPEPMTTAGISRESSTTLMP